MKKLVVLLFVITVACIVSSCGNAEVKSKAEEAVTAFDNKDLHAINQMIFNNDPITDQGTDKAEDSESVIKHILSKVSLSVKSTSDTIVVFDIKSPDMSGVFDNYTGDVSELDSTELYKYITEYSDNAETKVFTVELPVIKEDGAVKIDYQNRDFINAVTGGLLDEYNALYNSVLDLYSQGVEQ